MHGRPAPKGPLATRLPFFYGWVVLGVTSVALFVSGPGQTYSVSIFVDPIIADLETNRTVVSGLYTAGSLTGGSTAARGRPPRYVPHRPRESRAAVRAVARPPV